MNILALSVKSIGALLLLLVSWGLSGCAAAPPITDDVITEANSADKNQFLLGPEDVLEISVWRSDELTQKEVVVRPDGKIGMPLIGDVEVSGHTAADLATQIAGMLKTYKENPSVSVKVKEVNSYYVYVLGDVVKPGKYQLKSHATVLQAIAMAGGFTPYAAKNSMRVRRTVLEKSGQSKGFNIPAHYDEFVSGEGRIKDFVLKAGDVLVVPSRVW
ncbi:MAG TPA: polysaccharide biosynthesis/export family protein [Nitrospira sp.]|nr:polysaccharide biosynthesis/export family protein [Nitrospira sp.]